MAEAVLALDEDKRAAGGLDIVLSLLRRLEEQSPAGRIPDDQLAEPVRMLEAIRSVRPDGTYAPVELPLTPLLDTTVLTSARGEPTVQHELIAEIPSAREHRHADRVRPLERSSTLARGAATSSSRRVGGSVS